MKQYFVLAVLLLGGSLPATAQLEVTTDAKTGKKGLEDPLMGLTILPAVYDNVQVWLGDTLITVTKGQLKGVFSASGNTIIPIRYDAVDLSWQAGSKLGFAAVQLGGKLGLYHLKGRLILPLRYEYARAIHPNLLVAKLPGDSLLIFFDAKGQELFKALGHTAWPGFNTHSIEIIRKDRTRYFLDEQGRPVFSDRFVGARWTDGQSVICASGINNGPMARFGLLNMAGDTILPLQYTLVEWISEGLFLIKTTDQKTGVVDRQGKIVVPLEGGELSLLGDRAGDAFLRRNGGNNKIYAPDGRLLFEEYLVYNPSFDMQVLRTASNQAPDRYHTISQKTHESAGLIYADGRQIMPNAFEVFQYGSEDHVLLARKNRLWYAYTLQGALVLKNGHQRLEYTRDPKVLYGIPETGEKLGFIRLDEPDKTEFVYDRIWLFPSGFFGVSVDKKYYLHDPSGNRINPMPYAFVGIPGPENHKAWRESGKKGLLVATGQVSFEDKSYWIGFDEKGKAHQFKAVKERAEKEYPVLEELPSGH